ncbi:MAG: heavy-metal-associated domain-containing protein [Dethiobacteraceae bacterium]|jgi:copper chaperone|nr:heavy-metal-associated domain-containing protein [Bacillota bacterium]
MPESLILSISGMTCNHCKMRVEKALKTLDGVESVAVDVQAGRAEVQYDPAKISGEVLKNAVTDAGYEVK